MPRSPSAIARRHRHVRECPVCALMTALTAITIADEIDTPALPYQNYNRLPTSEIPGLSVTFSGFTMEVSPSLQGSRIDVSHPNLIATG